MPPKKPVYQKLNPIEHILKRPDMYVGAIKPKKESNEWVADLSTSPESPKIIKKDEITFSTALLRIFIEVLSNAIDNVWRSKEAGIPCTKIKVDINQETGETKIWNDGLTIPIEKNEEHKIYNPELIFGHLLTGSNYDDDESRFGSGRNGLGVKLTNVFSKLFTVRTFDPNTGKLYQKTWKENMTMSDKEKITSPSYKKGFTEVIWTPDFSRFNLVNYNNTILSIFYRYVYDSAMLTKIAIHLNGTKVNIKNLQDYAKCFLNEDTKELLYLTSKDCEVVVSSSHSDFEHIAFTNGVFNKEGGVHVEQWSEDLFRPIVNKLNKPKQPQINIKDVKRFFRLFISATVPNPEFSSQSKTYLSSPNIKTIVLPKHINNILKWGVIEKIKDIIRSKELLSLKKAEKHKKSFKKIQGFDPANNAGSKSSKECTLILCEGLSAKTYAVSGIQVGYNSKAGRDWFGIYPLRGKLLNVRNASNNSIAGNKEITDVIQALGLHYGIDYSEEKNYNNLNYGTVMIMTDSDVDGIHISSLIMNFFHHLFPSLMKRGQPFIISMQTPIVKIFIPRNELVFYNEELFKRYMERNSQQKSRIKYYKGLGTSSDEEIKATFGKRVIEYSVDKDLDSNMNKVFNSKFSDERKTWLEKYNPKNVHYEDENDARTLRMSYTNFIDQEHIKFSIDDCSRSLPCVLDGLKQSQRKILYATFLKNLRPSGKSMKVAQLAGFVAEKTNYHHGEQCLFETITKMAQNFPGSNNLPLLEKDGQFGSRISGGKDAANARYIFTKLSNATRFIFPCEDDILLKNIVDEGDIVEPEFYVPIIPMILVNGCSAGIGTGWSCSVPSYNPLEIVDCVKTWISKKGIFDKDGDLVYSTLPELTPWYHNYTGKIEKVTDTKYISYGNIERTCLKTGDKIVIDELPINMWTDKFKDNLEDLLEKKFIKFIKNYSTPEKVNFVVGESEELKCSLETLKLKNYLYSSNMVLFDKDGKIRKFETVDDIIDYFCNVRYTFYELRKTYQLKILINSLKYLNNKFRFLTVVMNDELVIYKRNDDELIREMEEKGFDKKGDDNDDEKGYDYLLNMRVRSFTEKLLNKLKEEIEETQKNIKKLEELSETQLWLNDLDKFVNAYNDYLKSLKKSSRSKKN